jgi:hypothetical protein
MIMNNLNALGMAAHDSASLFELLEAFLKAHTGMESRDPEYGQVNGYGTFVSTNFMQDLSVFIYEILYCFFPSDIIETFEADFKGDHFLENLKKRRNAIHIKSKCASFEKRAATIVENLKADFPNSHFDLTLMYRLAEPESILLSSNIYYYHTTAESSDSAFSGIDENYYAQNISMLARVFSKAFPSTVNYIIPSAPCEFSDKIKIELFDYAFDSFLIKTKLSQPSAVRIMLMHSYVGFMNTLFEIIDADKLAEIDVCWLFFLAKLYSIRYDEVMDSFDNLVEYCSDNDKQIIKNLLEFKGFDRKNQLREFARNLRNLIHYGVPNCPPIYEKGESKVDIERVYLTSVNLDSIYDFREMYHALRFDMKMMQLRFRRLFNMDYHLSVITREMARGGKVL